MFKRTLSMGLQPDLQVMRQTRHDLAAEVAQLTSLRREQEAQSKSSLKRDQKPRKTIFQRS